ncbi:HD-GYP domain-containing protein [Christensenella intestinihominis]|uniref:HD-GYP domain-containing protein n=1 Tax=Christensenella intestinihominis TaxID=1851429 RepID=UPI000833C447|nr:HD domain-containing phosphohydrolase [Christensenella intestinihominis]
MQTTNMDKLQGLYERQLQCLCDMMEFRDLETGGHLRRISDIVNLLLGSAKRHCAWAARISSAQIVKITRASMLHDIGKISMPDSILHKPEKLTPEERAIMQTHCEKGAKLLEQLRYIEVLQDEEMYRFCREICLYHHERWNGEGYSFGLIRDSIPFWAHITALADVYDALMSKRVYRNALPYQDTINMINAGDCGSFCPDLLTCLKETAPRLKRLYD